MELSTGNRPGGGRAAPAFLAAADPALPLLTFYDDATGERVELSGATLSNWVVKTANLLTDDCGLGPGDRVAVLLPPHWQSAAVLLGAWTAGLSVDIQGTAPAGLPVDGDGTAPAGHVAAAFVALDRFPDTAEPVAAEPVAAEPVAADHRFVLGLAPMGAPLQTVPDGFLDYIAEVRGQADELSLPPQVGPAGGDGTSYQEWGTAARETARTLQLTAGDRVLVDAATHEHPVQWLLAPLAAGASVVLCAHLDPAAVAGRVASERVTRVL